MTPTRRVSVERRRNLRKVSARSRATKKTQQLAVLSEGYFHDFARSSRRTGQLTDPPPPKRFDSARRPRIIITLLYFKMKHYSLVYLHTYRCYWRTRAKLVSPDPKRACHVSVRVSWHDYCDIDRHIEQLVLAWFSSKTCTLCVPRQTTAVARGKHKTRMETLTAVARGKHRTEVETLTAVTGRKFY